jgi:hypothetical protein
MIVLEICALELVFGKLPKGYKIKMKILNQILYTILTSIVCILVFKYSSTDGAPAPNAIILENSIKTERSEFIFLSKIWKSFESKNEGR